MRELVKCVNCAFFIPTVKTRGTCHLAPPTHEGFPTTEAHLFCSAWRPDAETGNVIRERSHKPSEPEPQARPEPTPPIEEPPVVAARSIEEQINELFDE